MAIGFARIEFVSRSKGHNACESSAYYSHRSIFCQRTGQSFSKYSDTKHVYHEVNPIRWILNSVILVLYGML